MNISQIAPQQISLIIENTIRKNEFFITLHQTHKLKMRVLEKYCVYINILSLKVNKKNYQTHRKRLGLEGKYPIFGIDFIEKARHKKNVFLFSV